MTEISTLSPELMAARLGNLTASRLPEALARTKSGWAAGRSNVLSALCVERLTGEPVATFQNEPMRWGVEKEPHAIAAFEWLHDVQVVPTGYVPHPTIAGSGATPDGRIVGRNETIECKCPNTATHIATLLSGRYDSRYELQMLWQMACTGAEAVHFISYDPRMPPELQLFTVKVQRDDKRIAELEAEVRVFLAELDEMVSKLKSLSTQRTAA